MTTGSKASMLAVASTSFSVVPKRNGPWMRKQRDVGRNDASLERVRQAVANVVVGDRSDGGGFGDAIDVEQRGQRHAYADSDGEVGEDSKGKGDEPDGRWP